MTFVKIGSASMVPPDSVIEASVGGRAYAICNVGGQLHALDGICPHAGGPLGEGMLSGTTLMCPWHCYEFDVVTGENLDNPFMKVEKFPVKVEDGEIFIEVG